jgi:hypothetical protein
VVMDWVAWHAGYDDPSSSISARLKQVRLHLAGALDRAPAGPVQIVSLCAGQGHDVLGVLPAHPRRDDVRALLVEFDQQNARVSSERALAEGLTQVEVRRADAGRLENFADAVPADILLLCGIFGNISDADIRRTVEAAPRLCADGATVIWTRHRRPPDITPELRARFAENGFDEVAFDSLDTDRLTAVGAHRLRNRRAGTATPADGALFRFRPDQR